MNKKMILGLLLALAFGMSTVVNAENKSDLNAPKAKASTKVDQKGKNKEAVKRHHRHHHHHQHHRHHHWQQKQEGQRNRGVSVGEPTDPSSSYNRSKDAMGDH